jgi:hypothetical protein
MDITISKHIEADDLISSTIPEDTTADYDPAATYNIGDQVQVKFKSDGTTPRTPYELYQCLVDATTGLYPPDNPNNWVNLGATNRWAMFDLYYNTQSEQTDGADLVVEVDSGHTGSCGLFALYGNSVTLQLFGESDNLIKEETFDLATSFTPDYWEYFFAPFEFATQLIWSYPIYGVSKLKATITPRGDVAKCGTFVLGEWIDLGKTEYAPSISITDYSRKTTDDFGRTYLKEGPYAWQNEYTMWLPSSKVDYIARSLVKARGKPVIFNGNNDDTSYESLIVFGYYQDFNLDIQGFTHSRCRLTIEGLA